MEIRATYRSRIVPNPNEQHIVVVNVTNIERRPVTITGVYWKVGIFRKDVIEESPLSLTDVVSDFTKKLPDFTKNLEDGESMEYRILAQVFRRTALEFQRFYPRILYRIVGFIMFRTMKVGVMTSTGQTFEKRIDYYLRHWLSREPRYHRFDKQ